LIVAAIGASQGWLSNDWLLIIALALSFSFVILAPVSRNDHGIYSRLHHHIIGYQREERMPEDQVHDHGGATYAVVGMGRVGKGAYDALKQMHGDQVIGIDFDQVMIDEHREKGRNVIIGNPADPDFWENFRTPPKFEWVLITLPLGEMAVEVVEQLKQFDHKIHIAATARYPQDEEILTEAGIDHVFNMYTTAGLSFVNYVMNPPAEESSS
jgi:methylmalonyl-CoA mutase cobalamin-binding subunit